MNSLSTVSFKKLPDPKLMCSICLESDQASHERLSGLDLASEPKYVVHKYIDRESKEQVYPQMCHSRCFDLYVRSAPVPKCLHCNMRIDRLNGAPLHQIFRADAPAAEVPEHGQAASAARGAHLEVIRELLLNDVLISEHDRREAVVESAARVIHLEMIRELLSNNVQISEHNRGEAVVEAAAVGYLEMVGVLLSNNAQISEHDRGEAVVEAAVAGYHEVARALLSNNAQIPENVREWVAKQVVRTGDLEMVRVLLDNAQISTILRVTESDHLELGGELLMRRAYNTLAGWLGTVAGWLKKPAEIRN